LCQDYADVTPYLQLIIHKPKAKEEASLSGGTAQAQH